MSHESITTLVLTSMLFMAAALFADDKDHLFLVQDDPPLYVLKYSALNQPDGVIFLNLEPGCAGLPVQILSKSDQSYVFQVVYTAGMTSHIHRAKKILGVTSDRFEIAYKTETHSLQAWDSKQKWDTKKIVSITDYVDQPLAMEK